MSTVPLNLPGELMTEIIHDRVQAWIEKYPQLRELVFPDQVFPGTVPISKVEEGMRTLMLTDPRDMALLANPNYFDYYMQGLMTAVPVSPYWQQLMSSKDMFQSHQQTFLDFMQRRMYFRQSRQILGPEDR